MKKLLLLLLLTSPLCAQTTWTHVTRVSTPNWPPDAGRGFSRPVWDPLQSKLAFPEGQGTSNSIYSQAWWYYNHTTHFTGGPLSVFDSSDNCNGATATDASGDAGTTPKNGHPYPNTSFDSGLSCIMMMGRICSPGSYRFTAWCYHSDTGVYDRLVPTDTDSQEATYVEGSSFYDPDHHIHWHFGGESSGTPTKDTSVLNESGSTVVICNVSVANGEWKRVIVGDGVTPPRTEKNILYYDQPTGKLFSFFGADDSNVVINDVFWLEIHTNAPCVWHKSTATSPGGARRPAIAQNTDAHVYAYYPYISPGTTTYYTYDPVGDSWTTNTATNAGPDSSAGGCGATCYSWEYDRANRIYVMAVDGSTPEYWELTTPAAAVPSALSGSVKVSGTAVIQ